MRLAVSNPGALLVYGNPAKKSSKIRAKRRMKKSKKSSGGVPVATKTRKRRKARSAAQRANDKRLGAMARARHKTKRTKVRAKRKARRSKRRAPRALIVASPIRRRKSRGRRRGRRAGHKAKHRARGRRRGRSRGKHRARRAPRFVLINPGVSSAVKGYLSGLTHVTGNMHAATKSGWKGYAGAAGGAIGAVFVGTIIARMVMPFALKTLPSVAGTPMGARAVSFACYYTGGWAIAKFTPGLKQSTRDAVMFGALVASVVEIVKPGTIAKLVGMVPGVGPMIAGNLAGIESELGDYVSTALQGLGYSGNEYDGSQGFHDYENRDGTLARRTDILPARTLSELSYAEIQGLRGGPGVGNYATDLGNYATDLGYQEVEGLACPMADDGAQGG